MTFTSDPRGTLGAELHLSPRPVIVAFALSGLALVVAAELQERPAVRWPLLVMALTMYVVSPIAWFLADRRPGAARWFILCVCVALVVVASCFLGSGEALSLLSVPVVLAAAMVGPAAAVAVALGETTAALVLLGLNAAQIGSGEVLVALIAIWCTLGAVVAVYRQLAHLTDWMNQYYEQAEASVEEARSRRADYEQAMEDSAHAHRQLVLANERIAALRTIAEDAHKAKTMFVANVSHEFRTPLNMIIGLVSLMVRTPSIYAEELLPDLREDLEIVHRNSQHLAELVNDVLDLVQVEAGHAALYREWVDLGDVIEGALAVVQPLVDQKGLHIHTAVPHDLPKVYCDRTRIRQVILNLVSNAARFTDHGRISISAEGEGQYVRVGVADTGPGIAPEVAEKVFEPFTRGVDSVTRDQVGSGLGLSISKEFVERHGGRIWLESQPGVGSVFHFELPVDLASQAGPGNARWIREDWAWVEDGFHTEGTGLANRPIRPRVIVCDAESSLSVLLGRACESVEFVETSNLTQVAQEVKRCPVRAVLVNTSSSECLPGLVNEARTALPETLVVGCSMPPQLERALLAGAAGYLTKPVTLPDLERAIQALPSPVRRVLVVDDDPHVLRLFTQLLGVIDDGLEVASAASGEEALRMLRGNAFDLLLLDVVMPGMDGWQVLAQVRSESALADTAVVFLSGQDAAEQPLRTELLMASTSGGFSLTQLVGFLRGLPALLQKPA